MARSRVAMLLIPGTLVGIGILLAVMGSVWEDISRRETSRFYNTQDQLFEFSGYLFQFDRPDSITRKSLAECVRALSADSELGPELRKDCPMLVENKDAWGRPFILSWEDQGRSLSIRSVGRNGMDESGGGDDIQVRMPWGEEGDGRGPDLNESGGEEHGQ